MNEAEFVPHVAAGSSTTRAVAERVIVAVFCAIADSLARNDPVTTAECRKFAVRDRAARQPGDVACIISGPMNVGVSSSIMGKSSSAAHIPSRLSFPSG